MIRVELVGQQGVRCNPNKTTLNVGEILRFEAPRPTLTVEVTITGEAKFTLVQSGPGFQEFRADSTGKFTFGGDLTLDDGSGKKLGWTLTKDAAAGGAGEVL